MRNQATLALCLAAALALASRAPAQITQSPSGCPIGPSVLVPVGNFSVGASSVVTVVPIACKGTPIALLFGGALPTPVVIPQPTACPPGPCLLSCSPFITILGPNPFLPVTVTLPNDPTLVGNFSFCMQAACASLDPAGTPCVVLGDRTDVTVQ